MNSGRSTTTSGGWFQRLAPGILIAATGVGAGDLITASIAGSRVGLTILWAVLVGAVLKWVLNEGLARWQMATGTTLLEGWVDRLGGWVQWVFLLYLIPWTLATGLH
jgi:Mn2+/Fe2+ NRAMP family transporter